MFSQCYSVGLHTLAHQSYMFNSLVKPVLCFSCDVWGVDWISAHCDKGDFCSGRAETEVHRPFMRQSLGVNNSTTTAVMMQELNREPLMIFWLRMAAQMWTKALCRKEGDYLRAAVEADVRMLGELRAQARGGSKAKQLWSHHFTSCLDSLGIAWKGADGQLVRKLEVGKIVTAMQQRWEGRAWKDMRDGSVGKDWATEACAVRAAPESFSLGFKAFVYKQWFRSESEGDKRQSYTSMLMDRAQIEAVAQLRCGSHWLLINKGRFRKDGNRMVPVARGQRLCPHPQCSGCRDDEMHLLECPGLLDLRELTGIRTFRPGDATDADMREVFNPTTAEGWKELSRFLVHCKRRCSS
jgi:hypothetical protein